MAHNAAAMIFVHNHPSSDPEPSDADRRIIQRLKEALGLIKVRGINHIVIGGDRCVSLGERAYL